MALFGLGKRGSKEAEAGEVEQVEPGAAARKAAKRARLLKAMGEFDGAGMCPLVGECREDLCAWWGGNECAIVKLARR